MPTRRAITEALLRRPGRTFADEIGLRLGDGTPVALFGWLCASMLYSARIEASIATRTARELRREKLRTAQVTADVGVDVFCREAQAVWTELALFADRRALAAARALDLGDDARALQRRLDGPAQLALLVAALVRCDLAGDADEVLADARG